MKYTFSKLIIAAACAAMLSAMTVAAHATNIVADGDFVSDTLGGNSAASATYTPGQVVDGDAAWTVVSNTADTTGEVTLWYTPTAPASGPNYQGPNGEASVIELGSSAIPKNGGIEQTLTTTAGTLYDVTYYIEKNPSATGHGHETVTAGVADATTTPATTLSTFPTSTTNNATTAWTEETFSFYATSSSTLLSFVGNSVHGESALISDIVVTPVPEVSTMLGLFTLLGLGFVVLRKKQSFQPSNMAI